MWLGLWDESDESLGKHAAWKFWESEEDAVNAFLIWRSNDIDRERALERARAAQVNESFRSLTDFLEQFDDATPTPEQTLRLGKQASMRTIEANWQPLPYELPKLRRRRPRIYEEWQALKR